MAIANALNMKRGSPRLFSIHVLSLDQRRKRRGDRQAHGIHQFSRLHSVRPAFSLALTDAMASDTSRRCKRLLQFLQEEPIESAGSIESGEIHAYSSPARPAFPRYSNYLGRVLLHRLSSAGLAKNTSTPASIEIEKDGTVHVPAHSVPMSTLLSPEGNAYVTEHLLNMQNPAMRGEENGVPLLRTIDRWFKHRSERASRPSGGTERYA